jgi:hypothetical protein
MSNQTGQSENPLGGEGQNKTIYKYVDINHGVNRGRRCKDFNSKHKE